MIIDTHSPLKRIAVFFDGSFTIKVSEYYKFIHTRQAHLSFDGLHEFVRYHVAAKETSQNTSLCQIVESHFFRGRFSVSSVQKTPNPLSTFEGDRFLDQLLMHAGVVTHYYPMNEYVAPPEEKGIDVWFALEAYDLAVHKRFDVLVILSGDQDFVPLVRKLNGLGTRVMILGVNLQYEDTDKSGNKVKRTITTSQKLIDEASYTVMLNEEIDSKKAKGDPVIDSLFVKP